VGCCCGGEGGGGGEIGGRGFVRGPLLPPPPRAGGGGGGGGGGGLIGRRPQSGLAHSKMVVKDTELGISRRAASQLQDKLAGMPPGGGSGALLPLPRAASAGAAVERGTEARETFVCVDRCGLEDAASARACEAHTHAHTHTQGVTVPPNHRVVEMYDHPKKLHEIFLVPTRKPAAREDAANLHR